MGTDIASTGDRDTDDKKDVKGVLGLVHTSNVDQFWPTKLMKASSNFLMLTSGSKVGMLATQVGALRFGSPFTRTLSCSEEYKSLIDFEARGLHLVPFGRCAFFCRGLCALAAPVPTNMQSISHSGSKMFGLQIHPTILEALQEYSQFPEMTLGRYASTFS